MKTKRQLIRYLVLTMAILLTGICNLCTADAAETLTDAEKSSAYGFFVWLSENADDASDREDAAVAAQLLKGTVSSGYQAQVFNDGSISATGATRVSYDTILTQTSLGSENDATSLACVREAVNYIKLGNSYRALENLPALNVSSALMAMSELNANYQHALYTDMNAEIEHTIAFNALENLATCWNAGSRDFSVPSYDPYDKHIDGGVTYDGWYYGEKEKYEAGQTSQAGHYMTLTDRNNNKKMLVTGFGYTNRKRTESGWITITQYFSQHFSDDSTLYSIGSGITPDEYLTYLNRYDCYLNGHKWNEGTVTVEPACLTEGEESFTCTVCGETKTETIAALGHNWEAPTYTWAEDNSSVTAERICKNDKEHGHTETETVNTTSAVTTAAVCTKDGETTYTAVFENEAFEEQKKTVADIPALNHDWDTPVYTWADDNSTCTAARTCKHDAAHIDTETAKAEAKVTKPATCLEPGDTTYTAAFKSKAFTGQTKTVTDIPALGHDWEAPTYTWAEDNSSVTATRICKNDKEHEHTETETVNTTSAVTTAAVCTKDGETTYTAVFENEAFEEQKKTVADIPALSHDWDTPVYTWAEDNSTCTAARTCKHDAAHIETETVTPASKESKPGTCIEDGENTFTAEFTNDVFETQIKTVSFTGEHSWSEWTVTTEPTTTSEGIKTRVCSICRKSETELIPRLPEPETNAPSDTGNKQEDSASAGNQTSDGTGTAAGQETTVDDTAGGQKAPDEKTPDQQTPAVSAVSQKADDGSAVGRGASAQAAETAILRIASEEGPTGTSFGLLSARVKKVKNTSITLTWNRIAKSYIIFGNKCGKGNKFEKIQTVSGNSFTQKGLKKGTYYKYMVMAVDSGGKVVATSKTLHAATSGKKAGNPKKVSVKKKTLKIKKGKTAKISASIVKPNGKTVKNHRKLAYESADTKVAVVSKKGKVKAVGKGTTTIYVYAQNGVYAKVRITVK